jgi:hypothetical protein
MCDNFSCREYTDSTEGTFVFPLGFVWSSSFIDGLRTLTMFLFASIVHLFQPDRGKHTIQFDASLQSQSRAGTKIESFSSGPMFAKVDETQKTFDVRSFAEINRSADVAFEFGGVYDLHSALLPNLVIDVKGQSSTLGSVSIPLDTLLDGDADGEEAPWPIEARYEYDSKIFLKLTWSDPLVAKVSKNDDVDAPEAADDSEWADKKPNELRVDVIQAKNLPIADFNYLTSGGTSDPFVRLRLRGHKDKVTKVIKKTLNPVWRERLILSPVLESHLAMEVVVEDHDKLSISNDFLGKIYLPLKDFVTKKPTLKWYKLLNEHGESDGKDRGEVCLQVQWCYNHIVWQKVQSEANARVAKGKGGQILSNTLNVLVGGDGAESDEESDGDDVADDALAPPSQKEQDAAREAKEAAEREEAKYRGNIEVKEGEYSLHVHVIEARDLKGEDGNGLSDPVVYIEAFGQKQNTAVMWRQTSCVFDETLIFNIKNVTKESFEYGLIRIACKDANIIRGAKMIGQYTFDAASVYFEKGHEVRRKWLALMDDEDPEDVGVQGYLKVSVSLLGPGDKRIDYDEDEELKKEREQEALSGGDLGGLVLVPPTLKKSWKYVVATIWRAEGLPIMDGQTLVSESKTDAFFQLEFAGGKPIRTRIKTVKGSRHDMNPTFNYELWYPVSVPTATQLIKASVWDSDTTHNELIAMHTERFNLLERTNNRDTGVKWVSLYGAPETKDQTNITDQIKKVGRAMTRLGRSLTGGINPRDFYNANPGAASSYKGRILLRFRIEDERPPKYEGPEIKPFRRKVAPLGIHNSPRLQEYKLKALVCMGTEIKCFNDLAKLGSKKMTLKISWGIHEMSTIAAVNENGVVNWSQLLEMEPKEFPKDNLDDVPDVMISLFKEGDRSATSFRRFKAKDLMAKKRVYKAQLDKNGKPALGDDDKPILKEWDELVSNFNAPARWILLEPDLVTAQLDDNDFPGNILIKLGFGFPGDEENERLHWADAEERLSVRQNYVLRMHVFQGKNLPVADDNGQSDPYVKVNFKGKSKKTEYIRKTLYPQWYEVVEFTELTLPLDPEFRPMVALQVWDHDDLPGKKDDSLGVVLYPLNSASSLVTRNADAPLPKPTWHRIFKQKPGDSCGQILLSAHLIELDPSMTNRLPAPISIRPAFEERYLEIIALGLRDMKPFHFVPMQNPCVEIEVQGVGKDKNEIYSTKNSKVPSSQNPNFLERIVVPFNCPPEVEPDKAIFATTLLLRARDKRLGGFTKPVVGVGAIDIESKIPWSHNYKPPQSDSFFKSATRKGDVGHGVDEEDAEGEKRAREDECERMRLSDEALLELEGLKPKRGDDKLVVTKAPLDLNALYREQTGLEEDRGAGIFGAVRHIDLSRVGGRSNKKKTAEDAFVDPDLFDEEEAPPDWAIGREQLKGPGPGELEEKLETTPFESYKLTRGQKNTYTGQDIKTVGFFKGIVSFLRNKNDPSPLSDELLKQLLTPTEVVVRLYALSAVNLAAKDIGYGGRPGRSDPYLKVTLGKHKFDDRKNAVDDTNEVHLFKMIEFQTQLPGESHLNINIFDKDNIGWDDLIGKTTIDLEDRWFDTRWKEWGQENMSAVGTDGSKKRWATKPIEHRPIYDSSSTQSQGVLKCWVDIMRPDEAKAFPPDDVSLPPKQLFEVRVVIWKARKVKAMDTFGGQNMSDLFVKVWPEGCTPLNTDTHWRAKKGKASWNWRLIFDVELGHNTRAMKFPYLHLQLWDKDLLKYNDCVGETAIDIGKWYRKAYKNTIAIKLYEKKKGAGASRAKARNKEVVKYGVPQETRDITKNDDTSEKNERLSAATDATAKGVPADVMGSEVEGDVEMGAMSNEVVSSLHTPDSDDEEDGESPALPIYQEAAAVGGKRATFSSKKQPVNPAVEKDSASTNKSWFSWGSKKTGTEEKQGLLANKDMSHEESSDDDEAKDKAEKEAEDDEVKELVSSIKAMTGLWEDEDPPDSDWLNLTSRDHNTEKVEARGQVCWSIQIWPKDKAIALPVGQGRNEPNNNPYLPPPVGRLKWSWNPFVLGTELCGPALCAKFTCCLMCAAFVLLMVFCQPFLTLIFNIIFLFANR